MLSFFSLGNNIIGTGNQSVLIGVSFAGTSETLAPDFAKTVPATKASAAFGSGFGPIRGIY
jgi:hypothetical protein